MIWLGRLSSKTLVIIALSVLGFGLLIALGVTSLTALASMSSEAEVVIKAMPEAEDPFNVTGWFLKTGIPAKSGTRD